MNLTAIPASYNQKTQARPQSSSSGVTQFGASKPDSFMNQPRFGATQAIPANIIKENDFDSLQIELGKPETDARKLYNKPIHTGQYRHFGIFYPIKADNHINALHLLAAVNKNIDPRSIRLLVSKKVDVNGKESYTGYTPLHRHMIQETPKQQFTQVLLDSGARVNEKDYQGRTPLHLLIEKSNGQPNKDVINTLIAKNANPYLADNDDQTPLHALVRTPDPDMEIVKALFDKAPKKIDKAALKTELLHAFEQSHQVSIFSRTKSFVPGGFTVEEKDKKNYEALKALEVPGQPKPETPQVEEPENPEPAPVATPTSSSTTSAEAVQPTTPTVTPTDQTTKPQQTTQPAKKEEGFFTTIWNWITAPFRGLWNWLFGSNKDDKKDRPKTAST